MSRGEDDIERVAGSWPGFVERLSGLAPTDLVWRGELVEGGGHVPMRSYRDGIGFILGGRDREVRDAVAAFGQALHEADVHTIQSLLTEQYLHVNGASGSVLDRETWLGWIASRRRELDDGVLTIDRYAVSDVDVDMFGSVALVTGAVHAEGRRNGEGFDSRIRFPHVWTRRGGVWRRAAFHDLPVPGGAPHPASEAATLRLVGDLPW